ncbi:hypothetical protein C2S53_011737 [Perilla frutescens var. hirtella]|uniref:Uncharacterized protein n=1 Tax=Perilla frutescens var. hirtella TaxID=608512 RepID=A0AAD4NZM9_PERFH|nr:hypothetical protein C2S53_011737 [Perilla frutescens var. hirtella]
MLVTKKRCGGLDTSTKSPTIFQLKPMMYVSQVDLSTGKMPGSVVLLTGLKATMEWFDPIWDRLGWLYDDHIDALLNLLLINVKAVTRTPPVSADMEMICWSALIQENFNVVAERVLSYVRGDYPHHGRVSWERATTIYGIGNVGLHWVAYEVLLERQLIIVYDSMFEGLRNERFHHSTEAIMGCYPISSSTTANK